MLNYRNLAGKVCSASWDDVFLSSERIQDYFKSVQVRFVERDDVIRKLKYAFMLREHVIMDGPTGSGKSALLNATMDNIQGANIWSMDLTKFTTDTHLFGAYDVKKMKEDGHLVHLTEGSLIEANFAKGGEFLDASDPTLRTMLGLMNERKLRRGPQEYEAPLISFVADTNFKIDDMPGRRQQLAAVLDRFLFQVTVDYVEDPRNRYTMLEMALEQQKRPPLPHLHVDDVVRVSGIIFENDLVTDRYVREAYQEMTFNFSAERKKAGRPALSDRRFVKAAHLLEVGAILHGRTACTFDDLQYTAHVLVQHADDKAIFEKAKNEAIEKWSAKQHRREIDREVNQLEEIVMQIPTTVIATSTYADLQKLVGELNAALIKLGALEPQSVEVRTEHAKTLTGIHELLAQIDLQMIARLVDRLPTLDDSIEPTTLKSLMQGTQLIESELRLILPKSDKARAELAKALEHAGQNIARLQVEFMTK